MKLGNICLECLPDVVSYLFIIGGTLMLGYCLAKFIGMVSKGGTSSISNLVVKILISHLQILAFIGEFTVKWPDAVLMMFQLPGMATLKTQFVGLSCLFPVHFYTKYALFLCVPLFISISLIMVYTGMYVFKSKRGKSSRSSSTNDNSEQEQREEGQEEEEGFSAINYMEGCVQAIILCLYLVHPSMVFEVLNFFKCSKYGDQLYLDQDTTVSCETDTYTYWAIFSGIYFVLYGLGLPLAAVWALKRYYVPLHQNRKSNRRSKVVSKAYDYDATVSVNDRNLEEKEEETKPIPIHAEMFVRVFGFILQGYHVRAYYWEVMIMLRKIAIVIVSVFYNPVLQLFFRMLILLIYIELHRFMALYE